MLYPLIPLVVRSDLCDGGARTLMCLTPPHRSHHRARVLVYVLDDTHLRWGSSHLHVPITTPTRQAILARDTQCDVLGATGAVVMRTV